MYLIFHKSLNSSSLLNVSCFSCIQGRNRNIFLMGAKSFFLIFFSGIKCFFPVENFHFGRPKTNFSGFEKWEHFSFCNFSTFHHVHFQFYTFPFTIYLFFSIFTLFPFSPCLFFPSWSAEISRSKVWGALRPTSVTSLRVYLAYVSNITQNIVLFI